MAITDDYRSPARKKLARDSRGVILYFSRRRRWYVADALVKSDSRICYGYVAERFVTLKRNFANVFSCFPWIISRCLLSHWYVSKWFITRRLPRILPKCDRYVRNLNGGTPFHLYQFVQFDRFLRTIHHALVDQILLISYVIKFNGSWWAIFLLFLNHLFKQYLCKGFTDLVNCGDRSFIILFFFFF